ncbi:hypothetical protein F3Q92_21050 [Salmonella enterica subsp. enterica]|nr:hypothetical protein [Salmonella enterica]ECV9912022.1 hypothetical protein [Salmonella enterica subsp. enterica]EAR7814172.1 hypothetical protein [Salmonella enterica]EBJ4009988.1 hypothetical protein [Salmonella enterica]EBQ5389437.1 hypothetical protein [Salmonella enterica]
MMKNRIFLPLLLALSATAFSASVMAASDSPPPDNTKHSSSGLPEIPWALIGMSQEWCKQYPPDVEKPLNWCQMCRC